MITKNKKRKLTEEAYNINMENKEKNFYSNTKKIKKFTVE